MRDIDFEELDAAVNKYFEKTNTNISNGEKSSNGSEFIIQPRRTATSASSFHSQIIGSKKHDDNDVKNTTESVENSGEKVSVVIKNKKKDKVDILDGLNEKNVRRSHKKIDVLNDNISYNIEDSKFEAPVLETKTSPEISHFSDKNQTPFEVRKTPESSIETRGVLRVPDRSGVFPITETDDEIKVFGAQKNKDEAPQITEKNEETHSFVPKINTVELAKEEKVLPEIGSKNEVKESSEDESVSIEKSPSLNIEVTVKDSEDKGLETSKEEISNGEKTKKPEIVVSSQDEENEPKTPFLPNPKIAKRPLGLPQGQPVVHDMANRDFKAEMKARNERMKEIRRAKMHNMPNEAPILNRDEYNEPVVYKKKKSGWGVVFLILFLLILGACGAGFAFYYLNFMA